MTVAYNWCFLTSSDSLACLEVAIPLQWAIQLHCTEAVNIARNVTKFCKFEIDLVTTCVQHKEGDDPDADADGRAGAVQQYIYET